LSRKLVPIVKKNSKVNCLNLKSEPLTAEK